MDLIYMESAPGLQYLLCRQNDKSVVGGTSILVDTFAVAEELKEKRLTSRFYSTFQSSIMNTVWRLQWCCWHLHVGDIKLLPTSIDVLNQNVCKPLPEITSGSIQDSKERWMFPSVCFILYDLTVSDLVPILSISIIMNSTVKVKPVSDLRKFIMKEIIRLTLNGNSRI